MNLVYVLLLYFVEKAVVEFLTVRIEDWVDVETLINSHYGPAQHSAYVKTLSVRL